jgi:hypothetical protein
MSASMTDLAIQSAGRYLTSPVSTPGETIGGVAGSAFGPIGSFVGGTVGRMIESSLLD